MKTVLRVYDAPPQHWVGDGFPVRSLFSYNSMAQTISPFLLLDRAGPYEFAPSITPRGVGQHPHRGFETVTIVYKGEVAHKDSTGVGGVIGPGDVQWMSAASGIIHEEFHSEAFTRSGGTLDMVQLWVNLPAKDKMASPAYQAIKNEEIPKINFDNNAGSVRIIAGKYLNTTGPARTFTPMSVLDIRLKQGSSVNFPLISGWNTVLIVLQGSVSINHDNTVNESQMALLSPDGASMIVEGNEDSTLLLLSGEPIHEPIVGYGPFVMNTQEEITQTFEDYKNGNFGKISH